MTNMGDEVGFYDQLTTAGNDVDKIAKIEQDWAERMRSAKAAVEYAKSMKESCKMIDELEKEAAAQEMKFLLAGWIAEKTLQKNDELVARSCGGKTSTTTRSMTEEKRSFKIQAINRRFLPFDSEKEKQWQGPFFFVQGADCQPGLTYRWTGATRVPCTPDMPMNWDVEIEATRAVIKKLNQMDPKPRFFIVCGDIVDAYDFEEPFRSRQENDIKQVFTELDPSIPLVCVCGNHDIGDQPTRSSIQRYIDHFGDDYFDFYCGGVHCIVLNSQFYAHSANVEDLKLQHEQWLDKVLQDTQSKHIIIFQHIPWFLKTYDEEKDYFNIEINTRLQMLEKFHAAGVRKIFCGHYHRNTGGTYKSMEQVVTTAIGLQLGNDKSGVRLVQVTENDIKHQFFSTDDIPLNFM